MSEKEERFYEFGNFRVAANERILFRGSEPLRLPPKTFDLLLVLVTNGNRIIEKEQLMREVWADAFVEDANLTVHISALRKILANGNGESRYIETVPKRGYRFTAAVRETEKEKQTSAGYIEQSLSPVIEKQSAQENNVEGETKNTERIANDGAESARSQIKSDSFAEEIFPAKKIKIIYALAAILIIIFASGYFLNRRFSKNSFASQKITRIPGTEKSVAIAISPDGQYLAHAVSNAGKRSLHTLHIASNSGVQLLPPTDFLYTGLTFSNDGNYIYYAQDGKDGSTLYKIPLLGGDAEKILANISGKISFSPDGNQFAFIRETGEKETLLMIADAGGNERVVSAKKSPEFFTASDLSWSPDGKMIVCAKGLTKKDRLTQIVAVNAENGEESLFSDKKWHGTDGLAWLADGSGVVVSAFETGAAPTQIWILPYPTGEPYRITNDLNNYGSIGLTADSKTLLAGEFDVTSGIWLVSGDNSSQPKAIKQGKHDNFQFISWTTDNRILFGSSAGGNRDIWVMNADGSNQKQLTANARENTQPTATFDNRYIVFSSDRAAEGTYNIWRMNIDGTNPVRLTEGNGEIQPITTADGKWVFYTSGGTETPVHRRTIWKVPIDGGESVQLTSNPSQWADISPDGKTFACWFKTDETSPWKIAVVPVEGGQPIKILNLTPNSPIRWMPDGGAISYVKTVDAVSNIWSQPIDGGASEQLTRFTAEQITNFDWSGSNQLVCSRGITNRDTILISNFR